MVKNIVIERFKKIKKAELKDLANINVLIGSNNSGKSSILQAIQFAVSSAQSVVFSGTIWKPRSKQIITSLAHDEFLYTPIGDIRFLYHGRPIKGSKKSKSGVRQVDSMVTKFTITDAANNEVESTISIYKGKIKNLSIKVEGKVLGEKISNLQQPFSVYVPGLSGIPNNEEYVTPLTIRKVATKGDANNVLRNVLHQLSSNKPDSWDEFISDLHDIFPDIKIEVRFREHWDYFVRATVQDNGLTFPLDCVGTGVLQAIQIFSYIYYFEPSLLLLDEPDAHVHPTNQKKIIRKLSEVAEKKGLKVILTTHSSHVLSAIDSRAKLLWAYNGTVEAVEDTFKVLMDIGALEHEHLFANKTVSTFILTEDEVEDIKSKKEYLKKVAESNGFDMNKTLLFSYHGCSNLYTAKILKEFIRKHIPGAEVIIHRDRDFYTEEDLNKFKQDADTKGINLFFTEGNDIESCFIRPEHLKALYPDKNENDLVAIVEESIEEAREESLHKIKDFLVNNYRENFYRPKTENIDLTNLNNQAENLLDSDSYSNSYSKKVKGLIVDKLAKKYGGQVNITRVSDALIIPELKRIADSIQINLDGEHQ